MQQTPFDKPSSATAFLTLLAGSLALSAMSGCAGTSPTLGAPQPQMNAPGLAARGGGSSPVRSVAAPKIDEKKIAPLQTVPTPDDLFTVLPYVQPGDAVPAPTAATPDSATGIAAPASASAALVWQTATDNKPEPAQWTVEQRTSGTDTWTRVSGTPAARNWAAPGAVSARVWSVPLAGLVPGALFDYRVSKDNKPVFVGRARAARPAGENLRFVVFGDCAAGTAGQKKVAYQTSLAKPDFVFITGDIVYDRGRESEYLSRFFPIYNASTADPAKGAPLLRSTLFYAAPGNHDTAYRDLSKWPDGMAYFAEWRLPLNGPDVKPGVNAANATGDEQAVKALTEASGSAFPRMANYSFRQGDTYWLVLDSNPYVDWTAKELHDWVDKELAGAKDAKWRFVAFHHPPFHSSEEHADDQQMRVLCDLFEKYKVDVVWSGHVHNYQRSYPLHFTAKKADDGTLRDAKNRVAGDWKLDKAFDGTKNTKPDGVIYIVTGAGGANLYDADKQNKPEAWLPFTAKYVAVHGLTLADVKGNKLSVRQIGEDGSEQDHFTITK